MNHPTNRAPLTGLLIPTQGRATTVTVTDTPKALAAAIQSDYVEMVRTPIPGVVMLADEEGYLSDKPINPVTGVLYPPGLIVGDVLVLGIDGPELTDLPAKVSATLLGVYAPTVEEVRS